MQPDDYENSMIFEVLGFDVILDKNCKPYLLEVNHSPSFATESPLDKQLKGQLVKETL
jgi:tubulin polyglutamylase TTLL6/13